VNAGYVVEASLGYLITLLLNVAMGVVLLHERMRPGQWLAIGLAICGVIWLTVAYGHFPWIGLTLAVSFACYGLLRKQARLDSLQGLTFETSLVALPALVYLLYVHATGQGAFVAYGPETALLLALAGPMTAVPLLMFAAGVRLLPLTTLGVLQYIAPTLQFLLGIFAFGEPFNLQRLIGFCLVWLALAVFTGEGYLVRRRAMALGVP
jgi:chloramphenicol-sensitive protein RarD